MTSKTFSKIAELVAKAGGKVISEEARSGFLELIFEKMGRIFSLKYHFTEGISLSCIYKSGERIDVLSKIYPFVGDSHSLEDVSYHIKNTPGSSNMVEHAGILIGMIPKFFELEKLR
ncbi:hypothetical protein [Altererythrobacter fulvus]|uniref:hypothetical protein n=1 Tax=Caenibius fulvus TaxID=2126012 RepID=UPI0030178CBF